MFHVVYSRDYWNHDEPWQFTNTWTIYRNVSYFKLREMQKAIPSLLKNADEVYSEYMAKNNPKVSNDNFIRSEVYVVDDSRSEERRVGKECRSCMWRVGAR